MATALSSRAPLKEQAVRRIVLSKEFNGKLFRGIITGYDKKYRYYFVAYEDGDDEEMTWREVMRCRPQWIADDAEDVPAGPPAKLPKKAKAADVSKAAAAAAAAATAAATATPAQQKMAASKPAAAAAAAAAASATASAAAAAAAAASGGEPSAAPVSKRQKLGVAAAAAPAGRGRKPQPAAQDTAPRAAAAAAAAAAAGTPKGAAKGKSTAQQGASAQGATPADAKVAVKVKKQAGAAASAAAAGAGADASKASKPKAPKGPGKPDQGAPDRKAAQAAAAAAAAGSSKAPKKAPRASAPAAAAAAGADTGPGTSSDQQQQGQQGQPGKQAKQRVPVAPKVAPLPEYAPARVCEEEWRAQQGAYLAGMSSIRQQALAARDPVLLKDGRPVFLAEPEDLPLARDAKEARKLLVQTETKHSLGQEPFRCHVLPPHVMELLLQADADAAIAAAGAAMAVKSSNPKASKSSGKASASTAPGASQAAAAAPSQTGAASAKQKGGKKAAAAAAAAAAAGDEQQQTADKGSKKKQGAPAAASATAAAAAGASAAAAAGASDGAADNAVSAPSERQYPVLYVPMEEFGDPQGKLARAVMQTTRDYYSEYRDARVTEERRAEQVKQEAKERGLDRPAKNPSKRPDRVAESAMMKSGRRINDRGACGHVPGLKVNQRTGLRALASLLGFQKAPMAGMVYAGLGVPVDIGGEVYDLKAVTSVVASGAYSANADSTDLNIYTGAGGNDLLGRKEQVADQRLEGPNRHMLVNWALGLPVRFFRRNNDSSSDTKSSIIYDGLYYVTSCCRRNVELRSDEGGKKRKAPEQEQEQEGSGEESGGEEQQGGSRGKAAGNKSAAAAAAAGSSGGSSGKGKGSKKAGKAVVTYVYGLRRLPGQPEPESELITHHKAVRTCQTQQAIHLVPHATCKDISLGAEQEGEAEVKNSMLVAATNEVDDMLPPGLDPAQHKQLLLPRSDGRPWTPDPRRFRYIRAFTYDEGVPRPQPPQLLVQDTPAAKAAEAELLAAAVAGSRSGCGPFVPPQYRNAPLWDARRVIQTQQEAGDAENGPHQLLARLNGGVLPWTSLMRKGKGGATERIAVQVPKLQRVLIECGDWTGCKLKDCPQRQVLRPLQYRLEVYKTPHCGWGVRSWDSIYAGSFVCFMAGRIKRCEDVGVGTAYGDSSYIFEMSPRSHLDHMGRDLKQQQGQEEEDWHAHEGRYVVCARDEGNVARFINHSCDPNLYVQPVLAGHTDTDHVIVGLFAGCDIPAFTPLSYDYGSQYLEHDLDGDCRCGADCCYSKLRQDQDRRRAAASSAASPAAAAAAAAVAAGASPAAAEAAADDGQ